MCSDPRRRGTESHPGRCQQAGRRRIAMGHYEGNCQRVAGRGVGAPAPPQGLRAFRDYRWRAGQGECGVPTSMRSGSHDLHGGRPRTWPSQRSRVLALESQAQGASVPLLREASRPRKQCGRHDAAAGNGEPLVSILGCRFGCQLDETRRTGRTGRLGRCSKHERFQHSAYRRILGVLALKNS